MKINIEKIKKSKSVKELLEFGIINIDKASGPTSFDVSNFVRKTLGLRKTSHFGTLDPKVTGVLPVALNRACKLTGFFLGEDKEYIGIMRLHKDVSLEDIKDTIKRKFRGVISQTPPVKSRVKRQEREREIRKFEILEKKSQDVLFKVACQGGTYIRKLIHDLGTELGIGAHMLELRRTKAGIFSENNKKYPSMNLYEFERIVKAFQKDPEKNESALREIIIPGGIISELHPAIQIKKEYVNKILHGSPIFYDYLKDMKENIKEKRFCVFERDRFIGIYKVTSEGRIFARPEFVFQPLESLGKKIKSENKKRK